MATQITVEELAQTPEGVPALVVTATLDQTDGRYATAFGLATVEGEPRFIIHEQREGVVGSFSPTAAVLAWIENLIETGKYTTITTYREESIGFTDPASGMYAIPVIGPGGDNYVETDSLPSGDVTTLREILRRLTANAEVEE